AVHVEQVVFARQNNVHVDASEGGGLQSADEFARGQEIRRHDRDPPARGGDRADQRDHYLVDVVVGAVDIVSAVSLPRGGSSCRPCLDGSPGGKIPVAAEHLLALPYNRAGQLEVEVGNGVFDGAVFRPVMIAAVHSAGARDLRVDH